MSVQNSLCTRFADILGGTSEVANGVCTVTRVRSNLQPLIQGKRTRSVLAIAAFFSFEDLDSRGNALNLGETVILQEEINPFITALRQRGIEVTAVHNHWLLTRPVLMFIHFKSIEPPLVFAQKTAEAFRVLTTRTIRPSRSDSSRSTGSRSTGAKRTGDRSRGRSSGEHRSGGRSSGECGSRWCVPNKSVKSVKSSKTRMFHRSRIAGKSLMMKNRMIKRAMRSK